MLNYSVIIPHKNVPHLLSRCLLSIPVRDDIEIIVVDDNSSTDCVDFEEFPGKNDKNVTCLFPKEGKGAGYARNLGLQHAKGKWILFADADDFFERYAFEEFDNYKESEADVIMFKVTSKYSDDLNKNGGREYYNPYIDAYINDEIDVVHLLLKSVSPWAKMVRRDFLESFNISFEETFLANDVFWTSQVAINQKCLMVSTASVYCVTCRDGSLVGRRDEQALYIRYEVEKRNNKYLVQHGLKEYDYPFAIEYMSWARCNGIFALCRFVKKAIHDKTLYASKKESERRFNYRHPFLYFLLLIIGVVK